VRSHTARTYGHLILWCLIRRSSPPSTRGVMSSRRTSFCLTNLIFLTWLTKQGRTCFRILILLRHRGII
jgi:hypothetical protein